MKEAILNAMNPIEKKILEKEVQKIHIPEEPIPFDDFGKKIRYVKKIRELLDQDAERLLVWKRLWPGRCLPLGS